MIRGSRDDAEAALARLRVDHAAGTFRTATSARDVRAACDIYLSEARTEKSTVRTDRSACQRICETQISGAPLGEVTLDKLDWKLLEYVYAAWGRTLTPKTVVRYGSTLSKVLEHAKRSGWISTNPGREAKLPRVPSHRPDVPQRKLVQAALRSAEESDPMMHAYTLGLASIGCRRSELLALRLEDVDFDVPMVTIRGAIGDGGPGVGIYHKNTKRSDWRDVPITDQVASALKNLLDARRELLGEELDPGSYVFSDAPDGSTCMRPDTMTHRWLAVRGPHNVTFAGLRRFVATELLDSTDGDYRTVASITGNSEETLRRWYHAGPNLAKKKAVLGRARL